MRPGYKVARVPNCSATISGAWLGSIIPPEPNLRVWVLPVNSLREQPWPNWRCRPYYDALPATSGDNPVFQRSVLTLKHVARKIECFCRLEPAPVQELKIEYLRVCA